MQELHKFIESIGWTFCVLSTCYVLVTIGVFTVDKALGGYTCKKCKKKVIHIHDWKKRK